ncbi:anaphase-promoting complex, cyclosome, subunit 4-domain-containing protein, partial [Melanogaster broomeanus]
LQTGSALSILKIQPLLDHLKETDENVTATDLFAFQGTQTRIAQQQSTPKIINQWPSLVPSLEDASIASSSPADGAYNKVEDTMGSTQALEDEDSLLALIDKRGVLHCFLDGSYFIGSITLADGLPSATLFKHPSEPLLLLHPQNPDSDQLVTGVQPLSVDIPLLATTKVRDFARLSSAARELTWYIMRVFNEVRESWFGSASLTGARDIGLKWVQALERRLREQYGQQNPNVILDLTSLLVTGSGSEGLMDFITSSEQSSERTLHKWDSSVTESLTKMRDCSTARIIPAFQRLHIIMNEIRGWSHMPQFIMFGLSTDHLDSCLRMVERGIFISSWLAAEARRELGAFKQFLSFIRHVANPSAEPHSNPDHDILEVNGYLMSGLMGSQIDRWFTGSAPRFDPGDLSYSPQTPGSGKTLDEALQLAYAALQDPSQTAWQPNIPSVDFSHLDRNLDVLIHEMASLCQRIFAQASQAAARSAIVSGDGGAIPPQVLQASPASSKGVCHFVRQRVVSNHNEPGHNLQYLAVHINSESQPLFCLSRMPYGRYTAGIHEHVEVTLLECSVCENDDKSSAELDILDAEFFDDETMILVCQEQGTEGPIFVATVNYRTLKYQKLQSEGYVSGPARKDMMANVLKRRKEGHLSSAIPYHPSSTPYPCMPNKFDAGHSPPDDMSECKADIDDPALRMSDIALRKKKNADAQAAFRQRRANYIATLEETVTSLESVVLQLQDSCREARQESGELKQDNARLRHELREREKFWRALWQTRKTGQAPESDDLPPLPPAFSTHTPMGSRLSTSHGGHYTDDAMSYHTNDDASSIGTGTYGPGANHSYQGQSPSLYSGLDNDHLSSTGQSHQLAGNRASKYAQYPYPVQTIHRDGAWGQNIPQTSPPSGSPTLTSPDMYANRAFVDEPKAPLNHLETTAYLYPGSRSISPTTSTPPSSSSTSMTSPFQFTFPPDGSVSQERPEFDYRRHSSAHSAEVTLHGGTADISLSAPGGDGGVRYRIGPRRANSGPERTLLPALPVPHFSGSDTGSQHERGSSEGESNSYAQLPRLRPRRGHDRESRSPSPTTPPISGTLAVIKAQAFGALRRTRTRTKKSSEGAAKVAMEVLEARGIGMGVATSSKRPRLHDDDPDMP